MPAAKVSQLRALLSEKFPGLRMRLDAPGAAEHPFVPAGLPELDTLLHGGFPKGALSEIIVPAANSGSSALLRALIHHAARANQIIALIDGSDSFDVAHLDEYVLSRLLWVRCHAATEAVKAADLVLRDSNLPLVLLDLKLMPENQLRKIPAATWYRFQRLLETTGSVGVVFTPRRMLAPAQAHITLRPQFSLAALDCEPETLLNDLKMEVSRLPGPRNATAHAAAANPVEDSMADAIADGEAPF
jgi:hypothetical protein